MDSSIYILMARALSYPNSGTADNARKLEEAVCKVDPSLMDMIRPYVDYVSTQGRNDLEEAYTSTFDIQAVCPLEIGYALFGEDYKRGEFLVRMTDLHNEYKTELNDSELADYLPNILMLLSKMPESEFKTSFMEKMFLPSLHKLLKNFDDANGMNPFSRPIRVLMDLLSRSYTMNSKILEVRYE